MVDYSSSEGLDVVIEGPHRGDIRCARLLVRAEATVLGDVVADVVKVLGRLDGNVVTRDLYIGPDARPRGWFQVSGDLAVAPGSFKGCTIVSGMAARAPETLVPMVRPAEERAPVSDVPTRAVTAEAVDVAAIEAGIDEALAAELAAAAGYGDLPEGFGGPDADEAGLEGDGGIRSGNEQEVGVEMIESLAVALRREVEAINARAVAEGPAQVAARAVRVALPSLV